MNEILIKIAAFFGVFIGILIFLAGVLRNIFPALYGMYLSWDLLPIYGWWSWIEFQEISFVGLLWGLVLAYIGVKLARVSWNQGEFNK
jgi:hypothetical protein